MVKIGFYWDNCTNCGKKLKGTKEKNRGLCRICLLKQRKYELERKLAERGVNQWLLI